VTTTIMPTLSSPNLPPATALRVVELDKSIVLLRKELHNHSGVSGCCMTPHVSILEVVDPLKLALDGVKGRIQRRRVVLLGFMAFLHIPADHKAAVWNLDLNRDADGNLCAFGSPVGNLHNNATSDDTRMKPLQRRGALADQAVECG
jgi:hypothetical protein